MNYTAKALLVFAGAMAMGLALKQLAIPEINMLHMLVWGVFMLATSVAVHYFTIKASNERPQLFPTYFMAITGVKMLVYIVALAIYVLIYTNSAIPAIITFLILYVVYTILEVVSALRILKK